MIGILWIIFMLFVELQRGLFLAFLGLFELFAVVQGDGFVNGRRFRRRLKCFFQILPESRPHIFLAIRISLHKSPIPPIINIRIAIPKNASHLGNETLFRKFQAPLHHIVNPASQTCLTAFVEQIGVLCYSSRSADRGLSGWDAIWVREIRVEQSANPSFFVFHWEFVFAFALFAQRDDNGILLAADEWSRRSLGDWVLFAAWLLIYGKDFDGSDYFHQSVIAELQRIIQLMELVEMIQISDQGLHAFADIFIDSFLRPHYLLYLKQNQQYLTAIIIKITHKNPKKRQKTHPLPKNTKMTPSSIILLDFHLSRLQSNRKIQTDMVKFIAVSGLALLGVAGQPIKGWSKDQIPLFRGEDFVGLDLLPGLERIETGVQLTRLGSINEIQLMSKQPVPIIKPNPILPKQPTPKPENVSPTPKPTPPKPEPSNFMDLKPTRISSLVFDQKPYINPFTIDFQPPQPQRNGGFNLRDAYQNYQTANSWATDAKYYPRKEFDLPLYYFQQPMPVQSNIRGFGNGYGNGVNSVKMQAPGVYTYRYN